MLGHVDLAHCNHRRVRDDGIVIQASNMAFSSMLHTNIVDKGGLLDPYGNILLTVVGASTQAHVELAHCNHRIVAELDI